MPTVSPSWREIFFLLLLFPYQIRSLDDDDDDDVVVHLRR